MNSERKLYGKIGGFRLLNIRVLYNDNVVYEGAVEDAPSEIKDLRYSKIEMGSPISVYVYE